MRPHPFAHTCHWHNDLHKYIFKFKSNLSNTGAGEFSVKRKFFTLISNAAKIEARKKVRKKGGFFLFLRDSPGTVFHFTGNVRNRLITRLLVQFGAF
jgi:hypothetical protein